MDKVLQAWKLGTIQDALNMFDHMKGKGKTFEDVRIYLDEKKKDVTDLSVGRGEKSKYRIAKVCTDCGKPMVLREIDEDSCHWTCVGCRKGIFINQPMKEEDKEHLKELTRLVKENKREGTNGDK